MRFLYLGVISCNFVDVLLCFPSCMILLFVFIDVKVFLGFEFMLKRGGIVDMDP